MLIFDMAACDFIFCRDTEPIVRHKDFRLFACMNPATDVGKKDLPPGVRNRYHFFNPNNKLYGLVILHLTLILFEKSTLCF